MVVLLDDEADDVQPKAVSETSLLNHGISIRTSDHVVYWIVKREPYVLENF